jgi:hypothetical protein
MKTYIKKTIVRELVNDGLVFCRNDLNESKFDKTNWYSTTKEQINAKLGTIYQKMTKNMTIFNGAQVDKDNNTCAGFILHQNYSK